MSSPNHNLFSNRSVKPWILRFFFFPRSVSLAHVERKTSISLQQCLSSTSGRGKLDASKPQKMEVFLAWWFWSNMSVWIDLYIYIYILYNHYTFVDLVSWSTQFLNTLLDSWCHCPLCSQLMSFFFEQPTLTKANQDLYKSSWSKVCSPPWS